MASEQKSTDALAAENEQLRAEVALLRGRLNFVEGQIDRDPGMALCTASPPSPRGSPGLDSGSDASSPSEHLSIVVLGASGDLSVKKTYPALFALFRHGLLPPSFTIVGYARSKMDHAEFLKKISAKFGDKGKEKRDEFLKHCWYVSGQYDSKADFKALHTQLKEKEQSNSGGGKGKGKFNRVFYLALPPTAFVTAARSIKSSAMSSNGWNRVVVEKPFGRDTESSAQLGRDLGELFSESEIFRIDHYLAKEMVQNLMVLRFANSVLEPLWNRDHINCVMFTFKEDFGTQGRSGYFDEFGIIRDVQQNHLMQMLSIVAMEPPISLSAEDVRDEKVRLLRTISPISVNETVIGQYTADPKGREAGYLDDKDVPKDSVTPTFATCVLHINNTRWRGVPFIMKSGKALDEKKADIRIQFKHPVNALFSDVSPNELVLRVGPDEAVYLKMTTKQPGLDGGNRHTELDLTYKKRFSEEVKDAPDAYERLILDVIRGDHNLFVRGDELAAAWKIFTPLLHAIEQQRVLKPIKYEFGSRGPAESDALIEKCGYERTTKYSWEPEPEPKKKDCKDKDEAASSSSAASSGEGKGKSKL